MRKLLLFFSALLLLSGVCVAQSTTVSATITDTDGFVWKGGTYNINFVPRPDGPSSISQYTWTGGVLSSSFSGALDSTGSFSVSIPSSTSISPVGSTWKIQICPNATSGCFSYTTSVTGGTLNLTTTLGALAIGPRFPCSISCHGYTSTEVINTVTNGTLFYDTTANIQYTWDGSWIVSQSIVTVTSDPTGGACSQSLPNEQYQGTMFTCKGGVWTASGGGGGGPVADYWLSTNCNGATNCMTIHGDGKFVVNATSNSTTTVTCPSNNCNFTAADVGKKVWATTQGSGRGYLGYTTYVCPVTTISAVNSAQSITLGTTCTASGTGNVVLIWGTDDGASLATLSSVAGCNVIHIPSNIYILDSEPFLNTAPVGCNQELTKYTGTPMPYLLGEGFDASQGVFVITPDFNYAGCTAVSGASLPVCIGGATRGISNLQIWGTGLTAASNSAGCASAANKILLSANPASNEIHGLDAFGVCPGAAGMIGIEINTFDGSLTSGGAQQVGSIACNVTQAGTMLLTTYCDDSLSSGIGLQITSGATATTLISNLWLDKVTIASGATVTSTGNFFKTSVSNSGTWTTTADNFAGGGVPAVVTTNAGGTIYVKDEVFPTTFGVAGTAYNHGGVKLSVGAFPSASTATFLGVGSLFGTCRGTATAGATIGLYGFGQTATQNCTSTTVNQGIPVASVPLSGSLIGFQVRAGTGGVNASDGVATVLKNGVATTITCTLGTSTYCIDTAHYDIPAIGDVYSVQVATQTGTTLANITATLLAW